MARGRPAKERTKMHTTGKTPSKSDLPDVYQEMLADVVSSSNLQMDEGGRAVKRRRVGGRILTQSNEKSALNRSDHGSTVADNSDLDELFEDVIPTRQSIVQTDSEDSADSDMAWEEVQLGNPISPEGTPEPEDGNGKGLDLVLKGNKDEDRATMSGRPKRKPITAEDKKLRLEVHKMHLCCLIAHVHIRNHWCNDEVVHKAIRKLLTQKIISYLNPDDDKSQFQRSRSFMDGLTQASEAFRGSFRVGARGMGRSRWADSPETLALLQPPDDIDLPMQITDYRDAAYNLEASRDVGAQLFCAMLRSAGVDARLVCSLQPLPFQPSQKVELHQVQSRAKMLAGRRNPLESDNGEPLPEADRNALPNARIGAQSRGRSASPAVEPLSSRKQRKAMRESKYPVYWVEAFNEAVQKWVPIDPLVTRSVAKPSKLEPPAGEPENSMTYVLAFENDGSARDVTRRYVKAYNAKTRRERVEITNGGEKWWRRIIKMFRRHHHMDRDQLEDAELASKEAAEPMPRNVQDFKDHPYYALERHLRRHEAIHPKREVGKVGAGRTGGSNTLEPIFRRRDVHIVKSADKWYRLGREIKPGEQPLKRVAARRGRQKSLDLEELDPAEDDNTGTALYAAHQTILYSAPRVFNGLVPKNTYGNLDVYVPSMVPPGGAHVRHPEAARAAKIIGVDYADAVTGFSFKGRHGTAIVDGVVVASEYSDAIEEVIRTFENDRVRAEEQRRCLEALRMWKKFLAGLRVRERIEGYNIEGEKDSAINGKLEEFQDEDTGKDEEAGGFFPYRDISKDAQPTVIKTFGSHLPTNLVEDEGGGFLAEEMDEVSTSWLNALPPPIRDPSPINAEDDGGGGFLISDDDADTRFSKDRDLNSSKAATDQRPELRTDAEVSDQDKNSELERRSLNCDDDAQPEGTTNDLTDETANAQINKVVNVQDDDQVHNIGSPSLPREDLEEARMLEQLYAMRDEARSPSPVAHESTSASRQPHAQDVPEHQIDGVTGVEDADPQVATSLSQSILGAEEPMEAQSPESDKGSLLSHDPEDEDAEPEWLA